MSGEVIDVTLKTVKVLPSQSKFQNKKEFHGFREGGEDDLPRGKMIPMRLYKCTVYVAVVM